VLTRLLADSHASNLWQNWQLALLADSHVSDLHKSTTELAAGFINR